jgi:hypothetical protein
VSVVELASVDMLKRYVVAVKLAAFLVDQLVAMCSACGNIGGPMLGSANSVLCV